MKTKPIDTITILTLLILTASSALAMEISGDLVFMTVREMGENQGSYLEEITPLKQHREVIQNKMAQLKSQILDLASDTSMFDRKNLEAQFAKNLAVYIKDISKELEITGKYASIHATTLYSLLDSLEQEGGAINEQAVNEMINRSKPVLQNSRDLYLTLAPYQDTIKDPVILNELQHAGRLAREIETYNSLLQKNNSSDTSFSRKKLILKIQDLTERFNAIACESDILKAIVTEEATTLQLVSQIASYELIQSAFSGGSEFAGDMTTNTLGPIKENIEDIRENIMFISNSVSQPDQGTSRSLGSRPSFPNSWPADNNY